MSKNSIENLENATVNLKVIQDKSAVAFPTVQRPCVGGVTLFGFTVSIVWLSLFLELCWFGLQASTANKGAQDAEEAISDGLSEEPFVKWLTIALMYIAAVGDLYTNVWGVSPKYDTNRLLYQTSDLGHAANDSLVISMKWLFYVSATPSYAVGAAVNWLGAQPLISSDKSSDAIYFEKNAFLFFLCLVAGMVYYFANARFGFSKTIETVMKYFYPDQAYPSSAHRQFIYGAYLRAFFAFSESFRTVLVRSLSFLALFDLLYEALRCDWPDEAKNTVRSVIFLTTAVAVTLSRLANVVSQWINPDYAKLSDDSKLTAARKIAVKDIVFNKLFAAEAITSAGVYLLTEFFLGAPVAAVLTSLYFLSVYAAVRDQRICKAAVDEAQGAQEPQGRDVSLASMEGGSQLEETDRVSDISSRETEIASVSSFSGEAPAPEGLESDPQRVANLRNEAIEAFAATFKDDVLMRCNVGCTLRVLARSFQLIGFVKDIAEKANLTLPLYGTLFMIASAVMRNEFFFFRGNMIEYQTLDAVAAYLIHSRLTSDQAKPFKEWYVITNWSLQWELVSVGVDDFTIEEIITASERRSQEMSAPMTSQSSSPFANSFLSASSLFACCRGTSSSSVNEPLL